MKLKIGCLLVLVVIIVPPVVAAQYLPWWGTLLVTVGVWSLLIVLGPKLIGWLFKRFLLGLFMSKSRVLRNAKAQVHAIRRTGRPHEAGRFVEPSSEPADAEDLPTLAGVASPSEEVALAEERDDSDHTYWQVEFTLQPKAGASRMALYDPFELLLVPYETKVSFDSDPTTDSEAGSVEQVFIREGEAWVSPPDKLDADPKRLRIVFRCPNSLRGRVKFQYYFETFGDGELPR